MLGSGTDSNTDSSDDLTDDETIPRATNILSPEELQAYSKPWTADTAPSRRGSCCSIRPDNVPALQFKTNVTGNHAPEFINIRGLFSSLQNDFEHYGNLLQNKMNQAANAVQRILLFPTLPPEEDELADEKIFIFNAMGRKLLPVLGIFHENGADFIPRSPQTSSPELSPQIEISSETPSPQYSPSNPQSTDIGSGPI
jgi:hypothetical protein